MTLPSRLTVDDKSETMKASLPDIVNALNLGELTKVIDEGEKLEDGTVVAAVKGATPNRKAHELGFEITEKKV